MNCFQRVERHLIPISKRPNTMEHIKKVLHFIKAIPQYLLIALIKFYRFGISPLLPASCRFIPTCSQYGLEAVKRFGFLKGLYLTIRRIMRCRPGGGQGYDPVPEEFHFRIRTQDKDK